MPEAGPSPAGRAPPAIAALLKGYRLEPVDTGDAGCAVFRCEAPAGPALYLKCGTDRCASDLADERARLGWLAGKLPVPAIRAFVQDASAAWLLTDAVPGRPAGDWPAEDRARLPQVVAGLVDAIRRLQALPVADCPFDASLALRLDEARDRLAAGLVDEDDFDPDHCGWSASEVLAEVERLASITPPGETVVSHGDFTLGNILLDERGEFTGCIDVG